MYCPKSLYHHLPKNIIDINRPTAAYTYTYVSNHKNLKDGLSKGLRAMSGTIYSTNTLRKDLQELRDKCLIMRKTDKYNAINVKTGKEFQATKHTYTIYEDVPTFTVSGEIYNNKQNPTLYLFYLKIKATPSITRRDIHEWSAYGKSYTNQLLRRLKELFWIAEKEDGTLLAAVTPGTFLFPHRGRCGATEGIFSYNVAEATGLFMTKLGQQYAEWVNDSYDLDIRVRHNDVLTASNVFALYCRQNFHKLDGEFADDVMVWIKGHLPRSKWWNKTSKHLGTLKGFKHQLGRMAVKRASYLWQQEVLNGY